MMASMQKLSVIDADEILMEDQVDGAECQPQKIIVYLNSNHKRIFLRIINAERNFIKSNPSPMKRCTVADSHFDYTFRPHFSFQIQNCILNSCP